jgi:hypothetical protein
MDKEIASRLSRRLSWLQKQAQPKVFEMCDYDQQMHVLVQKQREDSQEASCRYVG